MTKPNERQGGAVQLGACVASEAWEDWDMRVGSHTDRLKIKSNLNGDTHRVGDEDADDERWWLNVLVANNMLIYY